VTVSDHQLFALREAAGTVGLDDYRENYSGRGMYGKTCVGIVGNTGDLIEFVLAVADEDKDLAYELTEVSTDSMASDKIFYWRRLDTTKDEDET